MKNQNPFMPGDRVVCIDDDFYFHGQKRQDHDPKIGQVVTVRLSYDDMIELHGYFFAYEYRAFAPVQDATEMESEETEFAHYEEMTA